MSVLTLFNLQDATYWGRGVPDGFGGFTYAAPLALKVRWVDKAVLMTDPDGNEYVTRSVIHVPIDVEVDGYLYLGTSVAADPRTVDGAYRIKDVKRTPDLFNEDTVYKAML